MQTSGNRTQAEKRAQNYLRYWKWRIERIEAASFVNVNAKEKFRSATARRHFVKAGKEGLFVKLHKWPVEGEDD